MLSKQTVKFIKSLQNKKFRRLYSQFIVEGEKSVLEVLQSDFTVTSILATESFIERHKKALSAFNSILERAGEHELDAVGSLQTNNAAIAVCNVKEEHIPSVITGEWAIVLDGINDPGNLGTIIRIADWYGIQSIICSEDTADVYNPKVITSTKGSFTRVQVYYTDLKSFLARADRDVFVADLEGSIIHQTKFPARGYLVMGNEAHGIRPELESLIKHKITIPRYGKAESLNVGVAAAIFCDRIRGTQG